MRNTLAAAADQADIPSGPRKPPASRRAGCVAPGSARRAESRKARRALHQALVQIEAICSETADNVSTKTWRRLARGAWSLVAEFELDGRRYYLVNEDRFAPKRRNVLTRRERKVFHFVELGISNKTIAHSLGVTPSTVASLLHGARKKIRRSFRMELTARPKRELEKSEGNQNDPSVELPVR